MEWDKTPQFNRGNDEVVKPLSATPVIGSLEEILFDAYINQAVKTTSSPIFAGLTINGNMSVTGTGSFKTIYRYQMFTYFV